ncbi:MAG: histidinol-phosphatase HisJ family protein [Clostridia bacterium]|nr:histidinol-phosphatase HisJ family protein [Clostridia bacterium]
MATFDFHMHTDSSPDGSASAREMCRAAIERGLTHIAITDHLDFPDYVEDDYANRKERSWREQTAVLPEIEGKLRLSRGVEIGSPLLDPALTDEALAAHDYDFILASLHQLGRHPDFYYVDFRRLDVLPTLDEYFTELIDVVKWGRFQSLAHLTYPFRYIPEAVRPASYDRWMDSIDEIFRLLADKGLALEINTSGLRKPIGVTSPDLPLIRRFRELGGEHVTVGSDAHVPQDVGAGIDEGIELARTAGFRYVTLYEKKQPIMLPIT